MKGGTILIGAGLSLAALIALVKIAGATATPPPAEGAAPPPCTPAWVCERPLDGYQIDGCGHRQINSACNPLTAANVTAIGVPTPNIISPVAGEIDIISLTWQNTGGQTGSFVPKVSIDGGLPVDLGVGTITLAPGATYTVTNKALTGLSTALVTHTVCPVPN